MKYCYSEEDFFMTLYNIIEVLEFLKNSSEINKCYDACIKVTTKYFSIKKDDDDDEIDVACKLFCLAAGYYTSNYEEEVYMNKEKIANIVGELFKTKLIIRSFETLCEEYEKLRSELKACKSQEEEKDSDEDDDYW